VSHSGVGRSGLIQAPGSRVVFAATQLTAIHPMDPMLILDGEPNARMFALQRDASGMAISGLFELDKCRIRVRVRAAEFIAVLRGSVTATWPDDRTITLEVGDVALFETGAEMIWTVHETFRNAFSILPSTSNQVHRTNL
jgi:uncharacterized cupin superfamily protein